MRSSKKRLDACERELEKLRTEVNELHKQMQAAYNSIRRNSMGPKGLSDV